MSITKKDGNVMITQEKMYFEELEQNTLEGLYIRDLMKKEGKNA